MKIILFVIIFLLMNMFFIVSNYNLAMNNQKNIKEIMSNYSNWLKKISGNTIKITGKVIELNWAPE